MEPSETTLPHISPSTAVLLNRQSSTNLTPLSLGVSPLDTGRRYSIDSFQRQSGVDQDSESPGVEQEWQENDWMDCRSLSNRTTLSFRKIGQHNATVSASERRVSFALESQLRGTSDQPSPDGSEFTAFRADSSPASLSDMSDPEGLVDITNFNSPEKKELTAARLAELGKEQAWETELSIPKRLLSHHSSEPPGLFANQSSLIGSFVDHVPAPCGLNRWFVLVVCLLITMSTGSFFFNWPTTQQMVLTSGAYSWLCDADSTPIANNHGPLPGRTPLTVVPSAVESPMLHGSLFGSLPSHGFQIPFSLSEFPAGSFRISSDGAFPVLRRSQSEWARFPVSSNGGLMRRLSRFSQFGDTGEAKVGDGRIGGGKIGEGKIGGGKIGEGRDGKPVVSSGLTDSMRGSFQQQPYHQLRLPIFRRLEGAVDSTNDTQKSEAQKSEAQGGAVQGGKVQTEGMGTESTEAKETREGETERKEEKEGNKRQLFDVSNTCVKQIQAINSLMPVGVASWFFFSFVGGVTMDLLGPKITSITGLLLSCSGWIILGFCSQALPLYMLAFALIGCGVDVVFIGILNTANLFPSYRGTIVSLFNAARSLAFAIPSFINLLVSAFPHAISFEGACFLYAGFVAAWIAVVYSMVPAKPYPNMQEVRATEMREKRQSPLLCQTCHAKLEDIAHVSILDSSASLPSTQVDSQVCLLTDKKEQTRKQSSNSKQLCSSCGVETTKTESHRSIANHLLNRTSQTISIMKSATFYPLIPMAILSVLRGSFFSNSAMDQLGPFVKLFAILTPLSFIPAPVFGLLADRVSIHFVFFLLNTLGFVQFALLVAFHGSSVCLGVVTVLNLFISSFFLGQFYCYVTLSFPSEFTGTLVGVTISCSGLFGLLVTPMYNFSAETGSFTVMNAVCLGFAGACYPFIWLLWRANKRWRMKTNEYPALPATNPSLLPKEFFERKYSNAQADLNCTPLHSSLMLQRQVSKVDPSFLSVTSEPQQIDKQIH